MISLTRKIAAMALTAFLFTALPTAHAAREIGGVRFEDQVMLADQSLVLNGVGMRVKMIIKVYAMGLYVPRRDASPHALLNQTGPKSVRIVLLRNVSAEQLADSMVTGIEDNVSAAERAVLRKRLEALQATMLKAGDAQKGAVIQLDYVPGQGTHITLSGKALGPDIAGEDFYRALLKIWLGDNPSDNSLKRDLLGVS
jgi:hypothetical protein